MSGLTLPFEIGNFWTWFLLFARLSGVFTSLPGIGTEQVPSSFRGMCTLILSAALTLSGAHATLPQHVPEAALMIGTEYLLGYILGAIPAIIIGALSVAGQVTAAAIGLGQASLIDPSIGESVSVLARAEALIATAIFLLIDGHHVIIRAASAVVNDVGIGLFRPDESTASLFLDRFGASFELAVTVAGPVLVTILLTQFVLGLLTKFVPQINVFIISLPLTIFVGLFVTEYTFPSLTQHLIHEFSRMEETATLVLTGK